MAKPNIPVKASYIGKFLKDELEKRGFKAADVADHIGKSQPTLSRYYSGEYPIPGNIFIELLDLMGMDDPAERQRLIRMNEEARTMGWVEGFKPYIKSLANNVAMENDATALDILELAVMPGIIQTKSYAEALISSGLNQNDPVAVKRQVEVRMLRSKVLTKPDAPTVRMLLHEAILDQRIGSDDVTADQLANLIDISELPNVEVRLLPRHSWAHIAAGIVTGYTIFRLPEPLPAAMYIDSSAGAMYKQDPDIGWFKTTFDALWSNEALGSDRSSKRIAEALKDVTTR